MNRWRWPVAALVTALVLGTGGYAVAQTRDGGPSYRTARATLADVQRTLDLSGTVSAAGRRDLTFGAAGSVSRVAVRAGQQVRSGQVLARLDPTSFDAAVTAAVATVAKAEAQLASDADAQTSAVTAAAASSSSSAGSSSSAAGTSTKPRNSTGGATGQTSGAANTALTKLLAQLTTQQKAVTEAQSSATAAIASARTALTDQAQACQAAADPAATAAPSTTPTETPSGTTSTGGDEAADEDGGVSEACTAALAAVQTAQDTVAQRQDDLQSALTALGATLGQAVKSVGTTSQSPSQTQTQTQSNNQTGTQTQPATQSQPSAASSAQAGGGSGSATAARLAQDQADIDTAEARLTQARAEREAATLRAPYAGRILRTDIVKGDLVSATDPAFVLVGRGTTTVSTTVTTTQVPSVKRGQQVTITPAGWTSTLTGVVSAIGLLPDSSSAFPVTITVDSTRTVAEGTTAAVSVVTGSAEDAVTIPVSALTRRGQRASVQVLADDKVTTTQVTVGVLGTRRVSITKGLKSGASVVLADLGAEVPSSTSSATGGFRAGGTGAGAAGFSRGR